MSDLLADFERECAAAGVAPSAALKEGGVHPTLWKKWKDGGMSPTLRNFENARRGLRALTAARSTANDQPAQDAA